MSYAPAKTRRRALILLVVVVPITVASYVELYRRYAQDGNRIIPNLKDKLFRIPKETLDAREAEQRLKREATTKDTSQSSKPVQ